MRGLSGFMLAAGLLTAGATMAQAAPGMPDPESRVVRRIDDATTDYGSAANNMARGAVRVPRGQALCPAEIGIKTHQGIVKGWVGRIEKLSATNDG